MGNKFNKLDTDIERIYFFSDLQLVMFSTLHAIGDLTVDGVNRSVCECLERNMKNCVTSMQVLPSRTIESMIEYWLTTDYHDNSEYARKYTNNIKLIDPLNMYFWSDTELLLADCESVKPLQIESQLCLIKDYCHTIVVADPGHEFIVVQDRWTAKFFTIYEDNYHTVMIDGLTAFG